MLVAFHPQENCWFIFGLHGSCRIDWLSSETSAEATRQDRPLESRRVRSLLIVEFITLDLRRLDLAFIISFEFHRFTIDKPVPARRACHHSDLLRKHSSLRGSPQRIPPSTSPQSAREDPTSADRTSVRGSLEYMQTRERRNDA